MKNVVDEVKTAARDAEAELKKVLAAVEHWYSEHYFHASRAGVAPISIADKASLVAHVSAAVHSEDKSL